LEKNNACHARLVAGMRTGQPKIGRQDRIALSRLTRRRNRPRVQLRWNGYSTGRHATQLRNMTHPEGRGAYIVVRVRKAGLEGANP